MNIEKIERVLYDNVLEYFVTIQKERNRNKLILPLEYDKVKKDIGELKREDLISESRIEFERFVKNLDLLIEVIKNNSNNKDGVEK